MDNFTIVRPEHLNHHNFLFGGTMLRWIDEFSWLVASRDFPGCMLVTAAMSDVHFKHRVRNGSILRFHILPRKLGTTSVRYGVDVYADAPGDQAEVWVLSTAVTFVRVDQNGDKQELPRIETFPSST